MPATQRRPSNTARSSRRGQSQKAAAARPKSQRQYVQNFAARRLAAQMPGARGAPFPEFIAPALATLNDRVPAGDIWVHEIKFDGYRLQMHLKDNAARFFTRRGHDWTERFRPLNEAAWWLPAQAAVIDGEVVVQAADGTSDFGALELDLARGRADRLVYFAFDLLYLDGFDLRAAPFMARKGALAALFEGSREPLRLSRHFDTDGNALYADACRLGLEGLVSKRRDARYRSGRTAVWSKVTCRRRETFYAVGIARSKGRFDGVYLARRDGDELLYAGKVERGFTDASVAALEGRLARHRSRTQPLTTKVKKPKAEWYRPAVLVDVEFRALTGARKLRHPSYKGIRSDLSEA